MTHAPTDKREWTDADELRAEVDAFRAECEALLATLGSDDDEGREALMATLRKVEALQVRAKTQLRQIAEMRMGNFALNARIERKEAQRAGRGEPLMKVIHKSADSK